MKITSLIDDLNLSNEFHKEHGLSLYIQTSCHNILFDSGQSDLFLKNASKKNIDLSKVDFAILSHGHYDHGGGLKYFLSVNRSAPVYMHKNCFTPHFNGDKYIGLDQTVKDSNRIIFIDNNFSISNDINILTLNNFNKNLLPPNTNLTKKVNEKVVADDFSHEIYLSIEEDNKKALFSGCSHRGILNIVANFSPDYLFGGFHLSKLPIDNYTLTIAKKLSLLNTTFYTCHCTGEKQFEFIKKLAKNVNYLYGGQTVEI